MKIDWRYWLFLVAFLLTQAAICVSMSVRIDTEMHRAINQLSNQIGCIAGETELCEKPLQF